MRVYAANLNKNRTFKIVNREESVNFADSRRNNRIHTLSVAKKGQLKISAVYKLDISATNNEKKHEFCQFFDNIITYVPATSYPEKSVIRNRFVKTVLDNWFHTVYKFTYVY